MVSSTVLAACPGTTGRTPAPTWTTSAPSASTSGTRRRSTQQRTSPNEELVWMLSAGNHFKIGFTTMSSGRSQFDWPLRPKTWSRSWWQVMGCVGVPLYKIYPRKTQWRTEKPERTEEDAALISRTDSVDDMIAQVLSKKWVWVLRSWFEWPV